MKPRHLRAIPDGEPAAQDDAGSAAPTPEATPQAPTVARSLWHRAKARSGWHARRSPVYLWRAVRHMLRGVFYGLAALFDYLNANEYKDVVRDAKAAGDSVTVKLERAERRSQRGKRLKVAGIVFVCLLLGVHVATAVWGDVAYLVGVAVAMLVTFIVGRGVVDADMAVMLDEPDLPAKADLAPEHLNDAFRASGLLKDAAKLTLIQPILRDGDGWATVLDLPRGGGKTAADALAKRNTLAAELGVDEIQLIMDRVRAHAGGHGGRLSLWVADDDPYMGPPTPSPLAKMEKFSLWDGPIPFGADARGRRVDVDIKWQSMFFGGLPRRGKTFSQRLLSAAGILDEFTDHYAADFKGGQDWVPIRQVAVRLVLGAEDDALDAFEAMLDEIIVEMGRRFAFLRDLPPSVCPEGKLTPQIQKKYGLNWLFLTIDELQEALTALDKDGRERIIDKLCRIARRGPAAGIISNYASQRPDADSVPTKLREIITIRYSTQVVDRASSDMVLGKGKAIQGADASILQEEHKGVGVLVTGPSNWTTVKADYLDGPGFAEVCARGRALREAAGTLKGEAAGDVLALADAQGRQIPQLLNDALMVMRHSPRMFTTDLLAGLANLDEDEYGDWNPEILAIELEKAGVERTSKQVKISGENRAGYQRRDIEDAVPVEAFFRQTPTSGGGG